LGYKALGYKALGYKALGSAETEWNAFQLENPFTLGIEFIKIALQ
jgi:hypothetical protein